MDSAHAERPQRPNARMPFESAFFEIGRIGVLISDRADGLLEGVVRLLLDCDLILLNRFRITAQVVKRITKLVVCFRIIGLQLDRFAQFLDRFGVALEICCNTRRGCIAEWDCRAGVLEPRL